MPDRNLQRVGAPHVKVALPLTAAKAKRAQIAQSGARLRHVTLLRITSRHMYDARFHLERGRSTLGAHVVACS
jgi:hypothetical protein